MKWSDRLGTGALFGDETITLKPFQRRRIIQWSQDLYERLQSALIAQDENVERTATALIAVSKTLDFDLGGEHEADNNLRNPAVSKRKLVSEMSAVAEHAKDASRPFLAYSEEHADLLRGIRAHADSFETLSGYIVTGRQGYIEKAEQSDQGFKRF